MNVWFRNFILLALMVAASGLAFALRPTHKIADQGPKIDLEVMIPRAFGEWREEKQASVQIVDPRQKELLDKIYSQLLTRTYVNPGGYHIMLSIAYGSDQSGSLQVHKPEVCYPAQGFTLQKREGSALATAGGAIPVTRILTNLGPRVEPVTYWITVGDRVVTGGIQKKLIEMSYGFSGKIPDGTLIRVSSIDAIADRAYEIQNRFAAELLGALAPEHRQRFTGDLQRK